MFFLEEPLVLFHKMKRIRYYDRNTLNALDFAIKRVKLNKIKKLRFESDPTLKSSLVLWIKTPLYDRMHKTTLISLGIILVQGKKSRCKLQAMVNFCALKQLSCIDVILFPLKKTKISITRFSLVKYSMTPSLPPFQDVKVFLS